MVVKTAAYSKIESRNRPSFYATPVAWASADFTRALIEDNGQIEPHHTGMIVVSDECSLITIRELARSLARGTISPLRFAGASPSVVVGLPALQQGIRGPTLALAMSPIYASKAILAKVNYWIRHCSVSSAIVVAHYYQRDVDLHIFKGFITRSVGYELSDHINKITKLVH